MQYQGILTDYEFNGNLSTNHVFVYYGSKTKGGSKIPVLNYVANIDGQRKQGEIGKEWDTQYINEDVTAQNDVTYICNVTSSRVITLPPTSSISQGFEFGVKFIGKAGFNVTLSSGTNNIKTTYADTKVHSVVLDQNTPQCMVSYFGGQWNVSYDGINLPNNTTPYWKTEVCNTVNAELTAKQNTRYVPIATTTINLPLPANNPNFRIAVDTEHLPNAVSTTIQCAGANIKFEDQTVNTIVLDNRTKYVEFVAVGSIYYAFKNDSEFWITETIDSNTTALSKHRYICAKETGLTLTLPDNPEEYDRVAVYVQKLTSNTVQIKSNSPSQNGKDIVIGSTTINAGSASLQIEAPLVYVELYFTNYKWHVIKLITPSSQRDYKAGEGLTMVGTDTFVLTGTVLTAGRHTSIVNNQVNCTLSGGDSIVTVNNDHTITLALPSTQINWTTKTYVLACVNGNLQWLEKTW